MRRLTWIVGLTVVAVAVAAWIWVAMATALLYSWLHIPFEWPFDQWLWIAPAWLGKNWYANVLVVGSGALSTLTTFMVGFLAVWGLLRRLPRIARAVGRRRGGVAPVVRGVTDNFGNATVYTDRQCLRRFPGPQGVVIGELRAGPAGSAPLVIDPVTSDAGNGLFVAGNGAGKSSSLATMAMYWPGSAVILDPKVELAHMLAEALAEHGKRVHVIDMINPDSGFNVIGWLNPDSPMTDIKAMVNWIFPDDREEAANNRDPYFEPTGKALCAVILADLISSDLPPEQKNLATFRDRMTTPENRMKDALTAISKTSNSSYARQVANTLRMITQKQWSGIYGQSSQGTEWLSAPDLSRLVSGGRFPVSDILDGNTVIFVSIPLKILKQVPGVGRVIIGSILNAVYDAEGRMPKRCGFFLDEAWVLGRMQIQETALVTGRSFGITLLFFYQSPGQIRRIWGDDGISTLYNNLTWRAYAAVKDRKLAEEISEDFGDIGVLAWSEGDNTGVQRRPGLSLGNRSKGQTRNEQEIRRRQFLRQEITGAGPTDLFVVAGNATMLLRTPMAHMRREFDGIVKPSPHYRRLEAVD